MSQLAPEDFVLRQASFALFVPRLIEMRQLTKSETRWVEKIRLFVLRNARRWKKRPATCTNIISSARSSTTCRVEGCQLLLLIAHTTHYLWQFLSGFIVASSKKRWPFRYPSPAQHFLRFICIRHKLFPSHFGQVTHAQDSRCPTINHKRLESYEFSLRKLISLFSHSWKTKKVFLVVREAYPV